MLKPIFNTGLRQDLPKLSEAAEYAKELYRGGLKMQNAIRQASRFYNVDIHFLASELGVRGGKSNKRRSKRKIDIE
jgi:hypothetical protein